MFLGGDHNWELIETEVANKSQPDLESLECCAKDTWISL